MTTAATMTSPPDMPWLGAGRTGTIHPKIHYRPSRRGGTQMDDLEFPLWYFLRWGAKRAGYLLLRARCECLP